MSRTPGLGLVVTLAAFALPFAAPLVAHADEPLPADGPLPEEPDPEPTPEPAAEPAPGTYAAPRTMVAGVEEDMEPETPGRKGFFGGAAFGLGSVNTSCDSGGSACSHFDGVGFSLDAGYAFAKKWAVVGELWFTGGVSDADGDEAGQLLSFSASARYWATDRLWLEIGVGATGFDLLRKNASNPVVSAGGGGLLLGAGVELWRAGNGHVVLDLRARVGFFGITNDEDGASDESISTRQTNAMLGVSWY